MALVIGSSVFCDLEGNERGAPRVLLGDGPSAADHAGTVIICRARKTDGSEVKEGASTAKALPPESPRDKDSADTLSWHANVVQETESTRLRNVPRIREGDAFLARIQFDVDQGRKVLPCRMWIPRGQSYSHVTFHIYIIQLLDLSSHPWFGIVTF